MDSFEDDDDQNWCAFHKYKDNGHRYYKLKRNRNFLDFILGTQHDKNILYGTMTCTSCGHTIELEMKIMTPLQTRIVTVHNIVREE